MKNIFDDEKLFEHLKDYFEIIRIYMKEEKGLKFLETVLRYLFYTKDESRQEKLIKIIEEIPVRGEEIAMTIAEKYIRIGKEKGKMEGKLEGEIKGRIEGKIETAINLLKLKADMNFIHQATDLPLDEIKKLASGMNQKSN